MPDSHVCFPGTALWPMCPAYCPSWVRSCTIRDARDARDARNAPAPHEWPPRSRAFHGGPVPVGYEPIKNPSAGGSDA